MTFSRDAQDQERLIDYVRQALARIDAGAAVDPVELCREHPHLARPLAEVLGLAADLPGLSQEALREDPLAGLVLASRYRLDECRGRGAMGVVYRGEDQELRRPVAVKILDARLFRDPQAEQRFLREGEALAALQHPHIVAVHDRGRTPEGIHFLVMDLLEGCTLAALLDRFAAGVPPIVAVAERLSGPPAESHWPRLAARWAAALARGLAAAHARALVHRDVKPSNVFVRTDGQPVLLDFGIAARTTDERLTATQTTLGTPWYMAPEQLHARGLMTAEPTLDVYGLGATLYHLLAGRPPYEGEASSVLVQLQTTDPAPLAVVQPDLPKDLRAIVERALERDVARRYQTAQLLAEDLEAFLEHRPVVARPLSAFGRRLRVWRRAPAKPVAVAAVALALLVFLVALPLHREQQRLATLRAMAELDATVPSVLAIEGRPDQRVLEQLHGEHRTAIELLDRILALDPGNAPMLLFRSCLWLDLGDRARSAADFATIAASDATPYLKALAERYARSDPQQEGALAIDIGGLPEPATPLDCFVAGLHELRARHVKGFAQRADALLVRAGDYLPARDLRLMSVAALADQATGPEQRKLLDFVYDQSIELETIYGRKTARTLAMRGVALSLMKRYAEAADVLEQSLVLRPDRHGPHQNLGIAYLRLGRFEDSERHLHEALQCRSFAWNTKQTLAQLERMRGNFAAAYAWTEQMEAKGPEGEAWRQPSMVGSIAVDEAVALRGSDLEKSHAAAARAVEAYERALLANPNSAMLKRRRQLAVALQTDNLGKAMIEYAKVLLDGEIEDPYELANLAFLVPDTGLDPAGTAYLVAVLRKIAAARAAGNEALRARLLRELDERLKPYR